MSWTASVVIPKGSDERINVPLLEAEVTGNEDCLEERNKAYQAACDAAVVLINSGAFGRLSDTGFTVDFTGHVNPGNEPREGWSDDFVYINIGQARE